MTEKKTEKNLKENNDFKVGQAPKSEFVDLENAGRYQSQKEVYRKVLENNESPFLLENLRKYHQEPILREGKYWYITANQWPYKGTKHHFLIIAQNYWTKLEEITPEAGAELIEMASWLRGKYKIRGGALCLRFGDPNYSAGSVTHLHAQFIEPDREAENFEPIRFKIGKEKKGKIKN